MILSSRSSAVLLAIAGTAVAAASLPRCPDPTRADYDFVVVGAGAGGGPLASRLVESGYSVLLVDAGHDTVNVNTTLPGFNLRTLEDPEIDLDYTLKEYPPSFPVKRDSSWYPRARALGGSTIHNAMINIIAGTRPDFDGLAQTFNDSTWSRENMQNYFRRIEHNLYLPANNTDHGFDGWLKTSTLPTDVFERNPAFFDAQVAALVDVLPQQGPPIDDLNALASDGSVGVNGPSATIDENHIRSSVHERLQNVNATSPSLLHLSLDTLATKVLLCSNGTGGSTTAYGINTVPGAALPVASNFNGKVGLNGRNVTAKYEVIVSGGVFQSPQLLMLSGIGDKNHLGQFGIQSVVHLPGVGSNLQDHDEVSVIWHLKQNYTLFNGCTFLSDPNKDPCLQDWIDSNHRNLYAFTTTIDAIITKSTPDRSDPDVMTYFTPAFFPGFFRGAPQQLADTHNALSAIVLKAHPSSRGTVRLTGSHPQDRLDIKKFHFQAPGGSADVTALRNGVKRAREIVQTSAIGPLVETEVFPGANVTTDDQINDFIFNRVFGHHGCCTNAMGPDSDSNSVLDGNFRVRGVDRLRVVDASAWPHVPGFFITTPTYMMSEKAADTIISSVKRGAT
ncbi:hypothetical protein DXG01_012643 [Tephrocybe rancida]|nr:hypothetical protein DXG01_012643 [Tephrocybe rancida]